MAAEHVLTGVHHVRLPVRDLQRSYAFWSEVVGYERDFDFPGAQAWALKHPTGGPNLVLWHDPEKAAATSGFPWFSLGLPTSQDVLDLAETLDRLGIEHGGVQDAFVEIKLPFVSDPDGHLVGFNVKPLATAAGGS